MNHAPEQMTPRQAEIYAYLRDYFARNDQLPPAIDIQIRFRITGNAVHDHRLALERKGWLERNEAGKYRFTRLEGALPHPLVAAPKRRANLRRCPEASGSQHLAAMWGAQ